MVCYYVIFDFHIFMPIFLRYFIALPPLLFDHGTVNLVTAALFAYQYNSKEATLTSIEDAFLHANSKHHSAVTINIQNINNKQMKNTREIYNQKLHLLQQMSFVSIFEDRH